MNNRLGTVLAIIALSVAGAGAEEMREFVDLRLQGGLQETRGYGGSLTLMAGNLGLKDRTLDVPDDWGIVLGLRAMAARERLRDEGDEDVDINLGAGVGLIGIGYYVNKRQHCELNFGYGMGWPTALVDHGGWHNDGKATIYLGEFGWYWTSKPGWQCGVVGGWSWTKVEIDPPLDAPIIVARGNGLCLGASIGYRF